MRSIFALTAACLLAALGASIADGEAQAAPSPTFLTSKSAPGLVQNVRRRYIPRDEAAVVAATSERTAIVGIGPGSCGEFHYWDGTRCLDVRYMERHFK
jgi:hypothetical protein